MSVRDVLAASLPPGSLDDAEAAVTRALEAGRAAWPEVEVAAERLAARLADELAAPGGERHHDADLYLATALAAGDAAALRVFEARLVPEIDVALARLRLPAGAADEVKQAMRVDLLVGDARAPRIADYAGRGELAAWLRVTATRAALKLLRRTRREETLDDVLLEHWPDATPDPEHRHMTTSYVRELKAALGEALAALEVRQRNVLRQHVLDDLSIDELALLYRVHRATCARWLADARAELARTTRKRLVARLGARADEVESILRYLDSDLELSISRILRQTAS
jgi:RNA polymerase sigma-70 factor, ECF subfamily